MFSRIRRALVLIAQQRRKRAWFKQQLWSPFRHIRLRPRIEKLEDRSLLATWDGGGADNKWTTADNWVGNVAPAAGDSLTFPTGAARLTNTNDYASGTAFGSINFTGAGYNLGGNALELSGGLADNSAEDANNVVALTKITLAAPQTFANFHANFGRTFIVTAGVDTNGYALTIDGTVTTRMEGVVSGSGGGYQDRQRLP